MSSPSPSDRLAALVSDPTQRSYLKRDGWWAELILDEFDFLEKYGFDLAEVNFHFRGNFIRFLAPHGELVFDYAAEDGGWFGAELRVGLPADEPGISLDEVLAGRKSNSRRRSDDHAQVATIIRRWAAALRDRAPELLAPSRLG
jgi:hypothetical protein